VSFLAASSRVLWLRFTNRRQERKTQRERKQEAEQADDVSIKQQIRELSAQVADIRDAVAGRRPGTLGAFDPGVVGVIERVVHLHDCFEARDRKTNERIDRLSGEAR
jgi:hypothetical protein